MIDFSKIKCYLLDLDGTIYLSGRLIFGAREKIQKMRESAKILFLTNNSSLSKKDYLKKLKKLGLNPKKEEIYTSANALQDYLIQNHKDKSIHLLGTKSLKREFKKRKIRIDNNNPDILVASFDKQLTYKKLVNFCRLLDKNIPLYATHPDLVCPSIDGNMPDLGSFLSLFKSATNKSPSLVFGKPNKEYAQLIKSLLNNIRDEQIVMIGDRLSTDIQFAKNNNFKSVLVLSGETKKADKDDIDLIIDSINDLPI